MKMSTILAVAVALFLAYGFAYADSYNPARIAECIEDNVDERASTETIRKYCVCMNSKMPAGDTRSVTEWEAGHPVEMAVCSREAGWR